MQPKLNFLLLTAGIIISSCNSKTHSNEKVDTLASAEKSVIISPEDNTGSEIDSRVWDIKTIPGDWQNAKESAFSDTITFDSVKSSVIVKFTTLYKDNSDYVIKEVHLLPLKTDNKYALTATISNQINMGTKKAFNTYVMVNMQATLKPNAISTLKLDGKAAALYAKTGKVQIF